MTAKYGRLKDWLNNTENAIAHWSFSSSVPLITNRPGNRVPKYQSNSSIGSLHDEQDAHFNDSPASRAKKRSTSILPYSAVPSTSPVKPPLPHHCPIYILGVPFTIFSGARVPLALLPSLNLYFDTLTYLLFTLSSSLCFYSISLLVSGRRLFDYLQIT